MPRGLRKEPPRRIVVIWRDADGAEYRELRQVHFERGFGHFVRWNRHFMLVDPLQEELRIDRPGPRAVHPI